MKQHLYIKNISDVSRRGGVKEYMSGMLGSSFITPRNNPLDQTPAVYINANITLFVLSGKAEFLINYTTHKVRERDIVMLSPAHLVTLTNLTDDFRAEVLFVSREFMESMDPVDIISVRTRYGVKLYSQPVINFTLQEVEFMMQRLTLFKQVLNNLQHHYYNETVLSTLILFFLDLSNIIEQKHLQVGEALPRREYITNMFMELLSANYRTQHSVAFYASKLNITSHYLTLVVKQVTGQTVCDFIYEMLYSRARALLQENKMSIQEIASYLHFSDQSSFGKFFHRHSGLSPKEYRLKQLEK